jgi:hypothetical protein
MYREAVSATYDARPPPSFRPNGEGVVWGWEWPREVLGGAQAKRPNPATSPLTTQPPAETGNDAVITAGRGNGTHQLTTTGTTRTARSLRARRDPTTRTTRHRRPSTRPHRCEQLLAGWTAGATDANNRDGRDNAQPPTPPTNDDD